MTKKIIAYQGSVGANSNIACDLYYQDYDQKSYATFMIYFMLYKMVKLIAV